MSFMFHPFPYTDPRAVNPVEGVKNVAEQMTSGLLPVAAKIAEAIQSGKKLIGIDGYPGAQFDVLRHAVEQKLPGQIHWVSSDALLIDEEALSALIAPHLPEDRDIDPVLLYGVRYEGGYEGIQDQTKVAAVLDAAKADPTPTVVYGRGALSALMQARYDLTLWIDITPKQAALNFKYGKEKNLGAKEALPYSQMMRRNYYIDFENAVALRWQLIRDRKIDLYISADDPDKMRMLPYAAVLDLFNAINRKPFRCRPVYLEGVWGGFYIKNLRHLPDEMKNCAWVFDMIPMEVSLAAVVEGKEFEVPFFTYVQAMGKKLLGNEAFERFGGYFPVRFNYDDTYHANGNMSIQCHPDEKYVMGNHHELGRQDESYYICVTGQQACTYLGFKDGTSGDEFLTEAHRAENTGCLIDYKKYINAVPSVPGTQVMIPAGTIHASGRNQVILEIGSLTVGSYTYKLYDYQRIDPQTGLPRPIHLKAGEKVLRKERTKQWVYDNIVDHGYVVREGNGYQEKVVGEHDLLYFSLRNLVFEKEIEDDTKGAFHVLTLVDGERVRVESVDHPELSFTALNLDILVVPATFGKYRIVNMGLGVVTVHKTMLKETK